MRECACIRGVCVQVCVGVCVSFGRSAHKVLSCPLLTGVGKAPAITPQCPKTPARTTHKFTTARTAARDYCDSAPYCAAFNAPPGGGGHMG